MGGASTMFGLTIGKGGIFKIFDGIRKRRKSLNSAEWLERKLKDPYIEKAKIENYRCRSAFKLLEIDDKFKIIKPGQCVIDIGAAPGSWTQVLIKRTNSRGEDAKKPKGTVISVDRCPIHVLDGAILLPGMDFTKAETQTRIGELMKGRKFDLAVSDMAPNASGVKSLDAEKIFNLVESVLIFAVGNLRKNGCCLVKMWEGRHGEIAKEMERFFRYFNYVKPVSSHKESSEIFLLGRNFKGISS